MIAPIRHTAISHAGPTEPRLVGDFLSAVLARYGIVISAEELASVSMRKHISIRPTRHRDNASLRGTRPGHAAMARARDGRNRKLVQLALFPTGARSARALTGAR
jgi:hypothetical protein